MTRFLVVAEEDGLATAFARTASDRGDDVHGSFGAWRSFADSEAVIDRALEVLGGIDVVVGLTGTRSEPAFAATDPAELASLALDPMTRQVGLARAAVRCWERTGESGTVVSVHHTAAVTAGRPVFATMVTEMLAHLARLYETIRGGVHRAYAVDLRGDDRAAGLGLAAVVDLVRADGDGALAGRLLRSDGEFVGLYSHPVVERTVTASQPWSVDEFPLAAERLLGGLRR